MDSKNANDWYEKVQPGEDLYQGQILPEFKLIQATYRFVNGVPETRLSPVKVIILTQSCDLLRPEKGADGSVLHNVLIAPIIPITPAHVKRVPELAKCSGRVTQQYFLPENENFAMKYSIVLFASTASVPHEIIKEYAENTDKCIRLKNPYIEHLAHCFGMIFSRVALPEPAHDASQFKRFFDRLKDPQVQI